MTVDVTILRMLKNKADFRRVFGRIPEAALNAETRAILDDYRKYFEKFPEHDVIDMPTFIPLFRMWHNTLTAEKRTMYEMVLAGVVKDVAASDRDVIMRQILELRLATELGHALAQFDAGDLPNINSVIEDLQRSFKADAQINDKVYIDTDIHDILDEETDDKGLRWRLDCLNNSMRPLRPGDFGIIAGRPDKGKTSFIASEVSFLAQQLPEGRNVLWLNNEGPGKRIIPRFWQATLGATMTEMLVLRKAGALKAPFIKLQGRIDKLRVKDIHGMDNYTVEQIIEQNNADVVIYDMIDNIHGFGAEARTDQRLEEMYKWGRETAVKMNHIGIATSQISADGAGLQFPQMHMLKDSKTGKQGACDFQIMIGSKDDPQWGSIRWVSIPKNKLRRDGHPSDPRAIVQFDPARVRFTDVDQSPVDGETADE